MGVRIVDPAKVAQLARGLRPKPTILNRYAEKAGHRATVEAKGCFVTGWIGDTKAFEMIAPSPAAARVCAQAMLDLQSRRGTLF